MTMMSPTLHVSDPGSAKSLFVRSQSSEEQPRTPEQSTLKRPEIAVRRAISPSTGLAVATERGQLSSS